VNHRDRLKGIFLIAIALAFGLGALNYSIGKVERAGPGFFPLMVSSILFVLGAAMVVRAQFTKRVPAEFNVKNIAIIMGSLAAFALLSAYVNMTLGIIALVFVSAFAGQDYSVRRNLTISAVLIGIAFAFKYGLDLQLPLY
jgi:hypothetical protein